METHVNVVFTIYSRKEQFYIAEFQRFSRAHGLDEMAVDRQQLNPSEALHRQCLLDSLKHAWSFGLFMSFRRASSLEVAQRNCKEPLKGGSPHDAIGLY